MLFLFVFCFVFVNRLSSGGPDTAHVINENDAIKGKIISMSFLNPMNMNDALSSPLLLDDKMCLFCW